MSDRYCLTPLEAAETAGIELAELLDLVRSEAGIAIEVDGRYRVDPDALAARLGRDLIKLAA